MPTVSATAARARLYHLIDQVAESHTPILITGKRSNAVLISEQDWQAVQETLYLLRAPGMRETILDGLNTPLSGTIEESDL